MEDRPLEAVIVNYHTEEEARELLRILEDEPLVGRIHLVDNSGTFPGGDGGKLAVHRPGRNLGYGRAVNLAAERVRSPYLLVLNPDVRPLPGSIAALLRAAEESGAALLGPRFYWDEELTFRLPPAEGEALFWAFAREVGQRVSFPDGEILSYWWRVRHEHFWARREPFREPFLCGAALLVNLALCGRRVFDPDFFLYFEDTDLSLRLERQGLLQLCVPQAEMVHFWNRSPAPPGGKEGLFAASRRLFWRKHYPFRPLLRWRLSLIPRRRWRPPEDLGELVEPPRFETPAVLELSLSPLFIPFAQSVEPLSSLPLHIWERLPPGRIFLRLVDRYGRVLGVHSFAKVEP